MGGLVAGRGTEVEKELAGHELEQAQAADLALGDLERQMVGGDEAAEALNVSPATIRRLIADGVLPASQHCKGAPYVILVADLRSADVVKEADARRKRSSRPPPSANQPNLPFDFQ